MRSLSEGIEYETTEENILMRQNKLKLKMQWKKSLKSQMKVKLKMQWKHKLKPQKKLKLQKKFTEKLKEYLRLLKLQLKIARRKIHSETFRVQFKTCYTTNFSKLIMHALLNLQKKKNQKSRLL